MTIILIICQIFAWWHIEKGKYLIPSRTQKSSPSSPMVLHTRVWESRSPPGFSFARHMSAFAGLFFLLNRALALAPARLLLNRALARPLPVPPAFRDLPPSRILLPSYLLCVFAPLRFNYSWVSDTTCDGMRNLQNSEN